MRRLLFAAASVIALTAGATAFAQSGVVSPPASGQSTHSGSKVYNQQSSTKAPSHRAGRSAHARDGHMRSDHVRAAQEALNRQNASLQVDGKLGPATRSALASFQQAHGLKATGRLNPKTRAALNIS